MGRQRCEGEADSDNVSEGRGNEVGGGRGGMWLLCV
jgi:hypothetical protein